MIQHGIMFKGILFCIGLKRKKANLTVEGRAQKPVQKTFTYKRKVLIFPSSFVVISLSSRNNSGHANDRCEKTQASNNADDKQRNRLPI